MVENLFLVRFRQSSGRGKTLDEFLKIGNDRRNLGLLKHDLGNPNLVGAGILAPGHGTALKVEPIQKVFTEPVVAVGVHEWDVSLEPLSVL